MIKLVEKVYKNLKIPKYINRLQCMFITPKTIKNIDEYSISNVHHNTIVSII